VAKLRIEYDVLLQKEKAFKAEVDAFIDAASIDPSRYAGLHDLANSFFTRSKKNTTETEKRLSGRFALAALAIYENLRAISLKDAAHENYCDAIELRMAEICMKQDLIERAAELYANMLRRNPQSADAVYGLGLIYEKQGKWQQALQTWRKFSDGVEAGTYHWFQSRYRTAVALQQLGETEKACTVTTMTRVLHPDFDDDELETKFLELESKLCKGETAQ
jgi:tetratricopeptide (TPR) repeat protein